MKALIEKVRGFPLTVKLSISVLFVMWICGLIFMTSFTVLLTCVVAAMGSVFRLVDFVTRGK